MAYQALYRKYRPQRFGDIVGQDHVTLTLAREVQQGRLVHAYLFAGPRGTGKTTTARIIAKVLNCPDVGVDGEPCNRCPSCAAITEGSSLDVIELDAASHNKVEDVREIRANVGTVASTGGAHRVYILDEAHMLSRAAANALLKTLEEPPEHAYFVLATTEPYKLPDTIRSRAQRFDFHPIGSEALATYLADIATREKYQAAPDGLALIARHARGSVRDALGLLEQVAALGGGKVDGRGVTRALGLAPSEAFTRLARAISEHDAPGALGLAASLASEGADLRRFVADAIEFFRGVFLARYAPKIEEVVDEPAEVIEEWRAQARLLEAGDVLRAVEVLGEALAALREGREERLVVELALLRLARPETSIDPASLASRVDRLEERVRRLGESSLPPAMPVPEPRRPARQASAERGAPEPASPERAAAPTAPDEAKPAHRVAAKRGEAPGAPAAPDEPPSGEAAPAEAAPPAPPPPGLSLAAVETAWPALLERVRRDAGPRRHALLRDCRPAAVEGERVVLEVPANLTFHLALLVEDRQLDEIVAGIASALLGGRVSVVYRAGNGEERPGALETAGRAPDKEHLMGGDEPAPDPRAVVEEILGGTVVSPPKPEGGRGSAKRRR
ncbi:MAG: DNA polymerase III subunit gamma/tau [Acidimicrobiia bacterium]|nr:DNA polymerase III subunit gamma/tau [Acidimicrobiia bacterium]